MNKFKLQAGIMASSSFHMGPAAIIGAIPLAIAQYNTSPTLMQTIFALPALTAVPMSLIIGSLAGKTGKKIPIQIGTLLMLISGLAVALFELPLAGLAAAMAVMGLGLGCLMTLSTGLIADHFRGAEQSKVMAHMSAFANLGGMLLAAAGGILLAFGWKYIFWIFLYALIVLAVNHIFLPQDRKATEQVDSNSKIKLNAHVFIFCGMVFVLGLSFGIRSANAGLLVVQHGLGAVALANYATTFWTAAGIVMGFAYGMTAKILKDSILPIFAGIFALGMLLMGNATVLWIFYIGHVLAGMGVATAMPTIISKAAQSVESNASTFVISMIFATINIANFAAPAIVNTLARLVASETAQVCFNIGAVFLGLLCAFSWFYMYKRKRYELQKSRQDAPFV